MATQEKTWNVANRLHSLKDSDNPEVNHIIAGADEIYDDTKGAKQSDINAQTDVALDERYTKSETYSKEQLDSLITTPDVEYVTVATFADLPQTGEANTIYRVSFYDGTQVDASKYALYAWNGATYQLLAVRSAVGEVFDVSEYNSGATYETLSAALAAVPASVQRGGMSIKFVQSSDNKYVQYRLMSDSFNTTVSNWYKDVVSISQNISSGHSDININNQNYPVPSLGDLFAKGILSFEFDIVGGINGSDGTDSNNSDYRRTQYAKVEQGQVLSYNVSAGSTGWATVACYDSNGDYLSAVTIKGESSGTFTIPSGVSFIRLSSFASYANTFARFPYNADNVIDKAITDKQLSDKLFAIINRDVVKFDIDGGVGYADGKISLTPSTGRKTTYFIAVKEGERIDYTCYAGSAGWAAVAAYDTSFNYIKSASIAGNPQLLTPSVGTYIVPSGVAYLILSGMVGYDNSISFDTFETERVVNVADERISVFDGYLLFKNRGGINTDGSDSTNADYVKTDLIEVSEGDIINANIKVGSSGWCAIACYDLLRNFISAQSVIGTGQVQVITNMIIPQGVSYIKISKLKNYTDGWATKNKVIRENELEKDADLTRVNEVSVMKYPNILQQRGCIAIQMDLSYLDNARSGCDSMIEVMREYGLMSMDYAINVTALQDSEINKLIERQAEGCEIIYHNRINSPSDFSESSTLTVEELKAGVCAEKTLMAQKGFTTFGVVANVGSLATRYKPTVDNIFFWSEYGSTVIMTEGAENTKVQYLTDHRIIRTNFEIVPAQYTAELEAEMIAKGKAWIDDLCTNKSFGIMYCHFYNITSRTDYYLYESVLRAMCAYIADKVNSGELWYGSTTECLNYLCR